MIYNTRNRSNDTTESQKKRLVWLAETFFLCSVGQQVWLFLEFVLKYIAKIKAFVLLKLFL